MLPGEDWKSLSNFAHSHWYVEMDEVGNFLQQLRDPETHRFHSVTAQQFLECWEHYDTDKNGFLDGEELDNFLKHFVHSVVAEDVGSEVISEIALKRLKTDFLSAYDDNNDGRIDIHEMASVLPVEENFLALIRHDLPLTNSVEFMRMWKQFAHADGEYIELDGLKDFLKHLIGDAAEAQISEQKLAEYLETLVKLFDRNGDGKIQLCEMARILPVKENFLVKPLFKRTKNVTKSDINRIFNKYDVDKSGQLENEEVTGFLKDLIEATGSNFDLERLDQMKEAIMKEWDVNGDGKIGREELAYLIQQTIWVAQEAEAMQQSC